MALLIGQTLVTDIAPVSELTRQAIAFVDGGTEWLRWAVHGERIRATFADESQMAGGIQSGLHGTPFAYLIHLNLMVSPIKLMTFSLEDLRLVAEAERAGKSDGRIERIIEAHGLVTGADMDKAQAWLNKLLWDGAPLTASPILKVLNFHDLALLAQLAAHVAAQKVDTKLSNAAATFAIQEARSPVEFADFYLTYLGVAQKLASGADIGKAAKSCVDLLSPLAFDALDCPQTQPLSGPDAVALAVEYWAASGRPVGFARISACVREIVLHTHFVGGEHWDKDRAAWARNRLEAYREVSLALIKRAKLTRPRMGQDGATCRYLLEAGDYAAELQMSPDGVITLESLRDLPPAGGIIDPFQPVQPKKRTHNVDQEEDDVQS